MLLFYSHRYIYTQKCVSYVPFKNSMFHENYVNNVKCFYYVTKEENQHSHVGLGKYLDNVEFMVKQSEILQSSLFMK